MRGGFPIRNSSRVWIHRLAHQLEPKAPRFDPALMPPLTSIGFVYS